MIKALIIDDEPKARALLEAKLQQNCPQIKVLAAAESATKARELLAQHQPELVFLDIAMPEESGFDLLRSLPRLDFEVIFVTGFGNYAIEAIKFCAMGYVLKPIQNTALVEAVENAHRQIMEKRMSERNQNLLDNLLQVGSPNNRIGIQTEKSLELIPTKDIIRCEGIQRYTKVYIKDRKPIISSFNLGRFTELLLKYGFYSVHKSHFINLAYVTRVDRDGTIHLTDDSIVPLARRRREEFLEQLQKI